MLFVLGVEEAVLDAAFGVGVDLFGEIVFPGIVLPGDFPSDRRDFAGVLSTTGTEDLPPVLDDSDNVPAALEREIFLLAESLLCLSINGDLAGIVFVGFSRGLVTPLDVGGAVLGLDNAGTDCFDIIRDVLTVVPVDVDLGDFDVTLDVVDDNDLTVDGVVFVVVVLALAGLAATLLTFFVSPRFVTGFFSVDVVNLEEVALVVLVFDFIVPIRGETLVFVAVVVVLDDVIVLVLLTLLLVLETAAALVDPSISCLGRAAIDLFAGADCDSDDVVIVRVVVEVTVFEGDVSVFVAVFVIVFVGRLAVVVVAFALVVLTVVTAEAASIASAAIFSLNSSSFAMSFINAFMISSGSISFSFFTGISSDTICFSDTSWMFVDSTGAASSICFCTIGALFNNVQDGFIIG